MKFFKFVTLASLLLSGQSVAEKAQEMKCYVKSPAGVDGIYLINVRESEKSQLSSMLVGRTFSKGKRQSIVVKQVLECVKETDSFNNVIARQLDNETVR